MPDCAALTSRPSATRGCGMAMRRTWSFGVFAAVSVVLALAAAPRFAQAADTRTGPALVGTGSPGRSTIPPLSSRLAALAVSPGGTRAVQSRITATPVSGAGSLQRQPGSDRLLVDIRVARPGQ